MRLPAGAVVLLAVLSMAAVSRAQVRSGGEFRVNTYTSPEDRTYGERSIASDSDGGFLVVWHGMSLNAGDVFGRRYDPAGIPLGAEFVVNSATPGTQRHAVVSSTVNGDFAVAWEDWPATPPRPIIKARRFDGDAQPIGVEFIVAESLAGQRIPESIAVSPQATVVTWAADGDIMARRFDRYGNPIAWEFRVNSYWPGTQFGSSVDADASGRFVVVWTSAGGLQDGSGDSVIGQCFKADGYPLALDFRVNVYAPANQRLPSVDMGSDGRFIVVWESEHEGPAGIFMRGFDGFCAGLADEVRVNSASSPENRSPAVRVSGTGDYVVVWDVERPAARDVMMRRFAASGQPLSGDILVNTYTTNGQWRPGVAVDDAGNIAVNWTSSLQDGTDFAVYAQRYGGLRPSGLRVDVAGNGVLEPGESAVPVRPSWTNRNGAALTFVGQAANPQGPPGGVPSISLQAVYPVAANGATVECSSCYAVSVPSPAPRPVTHWDASVDERILPTALGQNKRWRLHVGESFTDVPPANGFYRFIETLLHHRVTGGCTGVAYCPSAATTREQMAVFMLVAKEGDSYSPPPCTGAVFADVVPASPFCRFIEELARRGVVGGCGGGNYCPHDSVSREQMAVFTLRTLDATLNPPFCAPPNLFPDVPETSPFCRWVEELANRGIVTGCGGGNYCPADPVTREQMGVFISVTFGLTLYGV